MDDMFKLGHSPSMTWPAVAIARVILGGIEMIHMMRKQQAKYARNPAPSLAQQFEVLAVGAYDGSLASPSLAFQICDASIGSPVRLWPDCLSSNLEFAGRKFAPRRSGSVTLSSLLQITEVRRKFQDF